MNVARRQHFFWLAQYLRIFGEQLRHSLRHEGGHKLPVGLMNVRKKFAQGFVLFEQLLGPASVN